MKHLILLRHAKSSWQNPDIDDFDRSLNKRGKRGARALGAWVQQSEWVPDQVLCSSARRTRETWEEMGLEGAPDLRDELYNADTAALLDALRKARGDTVLLIGHNPGIARLAHLLVAARPDHPRFDDFPTGSLLVADFDIDSFAALQPETGVVRDFLTPHDLTDGGD
ncbi:SixA phosphatase family protein [Tropicimonas sp.]|uniref:SixA phosphatase family protein n=1 Tax=Tropicimonas sp. TaxID=2067044 RepID=UPI003A83CC4F